MKLERWFIRVFKIKVKEQPDYLGYRASKKRTKKQTGHGGSARQLHHKHIGISLKATKKRTLVKALIYRCWVILSTYIMLLITGQDYTTAILPVIIINLVWTTSYYLYDRLWLRIKWGLQDQCAYDGAEPGSTGS